MRENIPLAPFKGGINLSNTFKGGINLSNTFKGGINLSL